MVDRKKKMLRRNGYLAAVCALLLAGMLSGCAGGGDGGAQSGAPSENAQQAESGGSQAEAARTERRARRPLCPSRPGTWRGMPSPRISSASPGSPW